MCSGVRVAQSTRHFPLDTPASTPSAPSYTALQKKAKEDIVTHGRHTTCNSITMLEANTRPTDEEHTHAIAFEVPRPGGDNDIQVDGGAVRT